jgi:hypothetical protein
MDIHLQTGQKDNYCFYHTSYTFTLTNDRTLVAHFSTNTFNVPQLAIHRKEVTTTGSGNTNNLTEVTVTASSNTGINLIIGFKIPI